jgi:hypothetical protein
MPSLNELIFSVTAALVIYLAIILLMYKTQPGWFQNTVFLSIFGTLGAVLLISHFVLLMQKDRVNERMDKQLFPGYNNNGSVVTPNNSLSF